MSDDRERILDDAEALAQEMGGVLGYLSTDELKEADMLQAVMVRLLADEDLATFVVDEPGGGEIFRVLMRRENLNKLIERQA